MIITGEYLFDLFPLLIAALACTKVSWNKYCTKLSCEIFFLSKNLDANSFKFSGNTSSKLAVLRFIPSLSVVVLRISLAFVLLCLIFSRLALWDSQSTLKISNKGELQRYVLFVFVLLIPSVLILAAS